MPDHRQLPAGMTPRLLSRDEVAAYLGIVPETFEKHVRPYVPPVVIGSRRLWDIKALDRWLDQQSGIADALRPVETWLEALGKNDRAR